MPPAADKRRATISSGKIENGLKSLSSQSLVRPSSASGSGSKERSATEMLELCHTQLTDHLNDASKGLLTQSAQMGNEEIIATTTNDIFETLRRESFESVAALADAMRESTKSQLKAQAAVYEMKLANSRTSATLQLQHQAVEAQQDFDGELRDADAVLLKALPGAGADGSDGHREAATPLADFGGAALLGRGSVF